MELNDKMTVSIKGRAHCTTVITVGVTSHNYRRSVRGALARQCTEGRSADKTDIITDVYYISIKILIFKMQTVCYWCILEIKQIPSDKKWTVVKIFCTLSIVCLFGFFTRLNCQIYFNFDTYLSSLHIKHGHMRYSYHVIAWSEGSYSDAPVQSLDRTVYY